MAPDTKVLSLETGDTAIFEYHDAMTKVTIERVTPTGQIVARGMRFRPDGRPCGNVYRPILVEATPERLRQMEEAAFIKGVVRYMHSIAMLTIEQARLISDVLEMEEEDA